MATSSINGDLIVTGGLQVNGTLAPSQGRSWLVQDNFQLFGIPFGILRQHDAFATPISSASGTQLGLSTGGTYGTDTPYITAGDLKNAAKDVMQNPDNVKKAADALLDLFGRRKQQ